MQKIFDMRLGELPFYQIKNGEKTVEIRLNDSKRKLLKVGDLICFSLLADAKTTILCKIIALKRFSSFQDLFNSNLFEKCGCGSLTVSESVDAMYKYYSQDDELALGVLSIELELITETEH